MDMIEKAYAKSKELRKFGSSAAVESAEIIDALAKELERIKGQPPVAWEYRTYDQTNDIVTYHLTHELADADHHDRFPAALYLAAGALPVPEGYTLISVAMLRTWGVYEDVIKQCKYPTAPAQAQEPVAWRSRYKNGPSRDREWEMWNYSNEAIVQQDYNIVEKLFLAAGAQERKPIDDALIRKLWEQEAQIERSTADFVRAFARAIEAKIKEQP